MPNKVRYPAIIFNLADDIEMGYMSPKNWNKDRENDSDPELRKLKSRL